MLLIRPATASDARLSCPTNGARSAFSMLARWPRTYRTASLRHFLEMRRLIRDVMGREAHVKDTARFKSGWAFFPANGAAPAPALPQTSVCNQCHEAHGAVDTTFVQFYPTLLPKAAEMKTFSAAYLAEEAAAKTK